MRPLPQALIAANSARLQLPSAEPLALRLVRDIVLVSCESSPGGLLEVSLSACVWIAWALRLVSVRMSCRSFCSCSTVKSMALGDGLQRLQIALRGAGLGFQATKGALLCAGHLARLKLAGLQRREHARIGIGGPLLIFGGERPSWWRATKDSCCKCCIAG